jgi:hypothetical protein
MIVPLCCGRSSGTIDNRPLDEWNNEVCEQQASDKASQLQSEEHHLSLDQPSGDSSDADPSETASNHDERCESANN